MTDGVGKTAKRDSSADRKIPQALPLPKNTHIYYMRNSGGVVIL